MDVHPDYLIGADVSCLLNIGGCLEREKVVQLRVDAYCASIDEQ